MSYTCSHGTCRCAACLPVTAACETLYRSGPRPTERQMAWIPTACNPWCSCSPSRIPLRHYSWHPLCGGVAALCDLPHQRGGALHHGWGLRGRGAGRCGQGHATSVTPKPLLTCMCCYAPQCHTPTFCSRPRPLTHTRPNTHRVALQRHIRYVATGQHPVRHHTSPPSTCPHPMAQQLGTNRYPHSTEPPGRSHVLSIHTAAHHIRPTLCPSSLPSAGSPPSPSHRSTQRRHSPGCGSAAASSSAARGAMPPAAATASALGRQSRTRVCK